MVRIGAKLASNVCAASASCTTCVRRVTCALVRHARVVFRLRIGPAAHAHRPPLRRANRGPGHRRGPCESTVSSERLPAYVPRPPARSPARSDHRSESSHRVQLRHVDLSFNQIGEDGALAIERAAALNGRSASAALVYKSVGRGNPFAIETPCPAPLRSPQTPAPANPSQIPNHHNPPWPTTIPTATTAPLPPLAPPLRVFFWSDPELRVTRNRHRTTLHGSRKDATGSASGSA